MRCRKHPKDLSSTNGVCATCLRDRLVVIVVAAAAEEEKNEDDTLARENSRAADVDLVKSDHEPPPVVSPSTFHRRVHNNPAATDDNVAWEKDPSRFARLPRLFRSRSANQTQATTGCRVSNFWLFKILSGRRKKQAEDPNSNSVERSNQARVSDRGMSPNDEFNRSPSVASGYASEMSQGQKRTRRHQPQGHRMSFSALAICMTPLVTASPNRQWNQKSNFPPEMAFSGDGRNLVKPMMSNAASYRRNRSRKLVDIGKGTNR